jgi:4-amino-4-deoxy-L-arabinose transferase-like glycosyltransferase
MSSGSLTHPARQSRATGRRDFVTALGRLRGRVELVFLLATAGVLNLWGLSLNGWANTYYSAAVRSMSSSWHDFLFASLDRSGLMTVDKPPLSLWIQALSARVFGFHPLSLLVPQALMGVAAVGLTYDLVRRRFGRIGAFAGALALATTPVAVAVSRHNNPDELLALCSVAAMWCAIRALENGRTRWLVLSAICVGLGFETKMGVALMVVPGIVIAWLWVAPRGRLRSLRQLLAGAAAMLAVGGAWPLLVALTPAADRPWISGTSDNSILSLILGYNGLGRIAGQSGGPGGLAGGGTMFGGPTGAFRLLQSGLGDQAGWLLGIALVSGVGVLATTRLNRRDPRTSWLMVVGGAFLTTAFAFSFAHGIFHPYYVSLLAPFAAALAGCGVAQMIGGSVHARVLAPIAIAAGVVAELVVLGELSGDLGWARVLLLAVALPAGFALALRLGSRQRRVFVAVGVAALLAAPATWAAETLGHATNGTFPTGGPVSATVVGLGPARLVGGPRGSVRRLGALPGPPVSGRGPAGSLGGGPGGPAVGPGGGPGGGFGANSSQLQAAIRYATTHGGGTIAVASQSSAGEAIIVSNADVAGIGGFSGRESSVSVSWLAQAVRSGRLRWVLVDQAGVLPGDTQAGSSEAMSAVTRACRAVSVSANGASITMYDCAGRAAVLAG